VFVGGLHRSGTTPLARWLSSHPAISGLEGTGVYEDEGQHLQSVYPIAGAYGGPGRFALDPRARLTEESPLVVPGAAQRLIAAWSPYWDLSKPVLMEKSPTNLVRLRFLRALFPRASFIIVTRHPAAVAMATRKWTRSSSDSLVRNWLAGHRHLVADAEAVGDTAVVRYEDLIDDPAQELDRLFAFLDVAPHDGGWTVKGGLNDAYFADWAAYRVPWRRQAHRRVAGRYERDVLPFGYSLVDPGVLREPGAELARLRAPRRGDRAARRA
jgi:hypothetical protein